MEPQPNHREPAAFRPTGLSDPRDPASQVLSSPRTPSSDEPRPPSNSGPTGSEAAERRTDEIAEVRQFVVPPFGSDHTPTLGARA